MRGLLPPLLLLFSCRADGIRVWVEPDQAEVIRDFLTWIPTDALFLEEDPDPAARARPGQVALVQEGDCTECYTLDPDGALVIRGGAPLGLQYGLADLLERSGFRFFHPEHTLVPQDPRLPASIDDGGQVHSPELAHRALHLHTLHPTDAMFAFWTPQEGEERARRVQDWLVKNRANHVEWMGLDDIEEDDARLQEWRDSTAAIQEHARLRGLTTGLGVELYGSGNLQHAYDLLDVAQDEAQDREAMAARLARVMDGLNWDNVSLSFGEFFDEDPDRFIRDVDAVHDRITAANPQTVMTAWIHVGDDVRVVYEGVDQIYYFLIRYTDPAITRSVHTVMYYNLFDDACGAYHHGDFSEHRQLLLDELAAGHPVEYYPESAYWVAFDVSVPQFLPMYVTSRWTDLYGIRQESPTPLQAHTLFSTGWEWGYWMNDLLTLRMTWQIPQDPSTGFDFLFAPWGEDGAAVARAVADLARLQHETHIGQCLGGWMSGVDAAMEVGYLMDIVSQPRRTSLEEASILDASGRADLEATVLDPLATLADRTEEIQARLEAVPLRNPWVDEVRDGVAVDVARARFVEATYRAVLAHAAGTSPDAWRGQAQAWLERARVIVARRHGSLHDPDAPLLLEADDNPTLYDYGYLRWAHSLCYWEREWIQMANLLDGAGEAVPGCLF